MPAVGKLVGIRFETGHISLVGSQPNQVIQPSVDLGTTITRWVVFKKSFQHCLVVRARCLLESQCLDHLPCFSSVRPLRMLSQVTLNRLDGVAFHSAVPGETIDASLCFFTMGPLGVLVQVPRIFLGTVCLLRPVPVQVVEPGFHFVVMSALRIPSPELR